MSFRPTSDTAVPSYSSKLLSKPPSSLLRSLNYLDPLEDCCFCLLCFHGPLFSEFLICPRKGEGGRVSNGRRDGVREGEGERERGGGERKEGREGERERGRERVRLD